MHLEYEKKSSDFSNPSVRVIAETEEETFRLGMLAGILSENGVDHTIYPEQRWIRIPLQTKAPPKANPSSQDRPENQPEDEWYEGRV